VSHRTKGQPRPAAATGGGPPSREGEPAAPADPQVPLFELLPAFEEVHAHVEPEPVVRVSLDERSAPGRQLRLLATRVRALGRDKRLRRIGVIGSEAGEGTSTVALGLASALSRDRGLRVLLLELDLSRPSLDEALGVEPPAVGVRQYLAGASDIPVLRRERPDGFWVLSAGRETGPTGQALSSPRLVPLLRAVDRVFDYVVADCPPLLAGGELAVLQGALDGFVFVVRSRRIPRDRIQRAAWMLRPELLVGLVLNAQR
jgi:Mrp family chromosome partitioning ATPase